MSKDEFFHPPLVGLRLVEQQFNGRFLHRRDPEHEARTIAAIVERNILAKEKARQKEVMKWRLS